MSYSINISLSYGHLLKDFHNKKIPLNSGIFLRVNFLKFKKGSLFPCELSIYSEDSYLLKGEGEML